MQDKLKDTTSQNWKAVIVQYSNLECYNHLRVLFNENYGQMKKSFEI